MAGDVKFPCLSVVSGDLVSEGSVVISLVLPSVVVSFVEPFVTGVVTSVVAALVVDGDDVVLLVEERESVDDIVGDDRVVLPVALLVTDSDVVVSVGLLVVDADVVGDGVVLVGYEPVLELVITVVVLVVAAVVVAVELVELSGGESVDVSPEKCKRKDFSEPLLQQWHSQRCCS